MHRHNGIAHSSELRAAGFSDHRVRRAVQEGSLLRIRRSWLHTPECDRRLIAAARVGGRASCVTAAEREGLWVPPSDTVHVAVPASSARLPADGFTLHWSAPPVGVSRFVTREPLVNVLFHVARCLNRSDAMAIWESALRKRLVDPDELRRVRWRSSSARALADAAGDLSDSGLETRFVGLMRSVGVAVRQQVWVDGHPLDGLIGDRLAIQIDGFEHHRAADRRRDIAADARLALRGYTTLRFDYQQVFFDEDHVTGTVLMALAQGLHLA